MTEQRTLPLDAIAVVGMACRFPQAPTVTEFWRNLRAGADAVRFFSHEELEAAGCNPREIRSPDYVPARAVLADVDLFDAGFFGFSPREAERTDPQHRMLFLCCWEALESAGYGLAEQEVPVGVFVGAGVSSYLPPQLWDTEAQIGNSRDFLATRISFKLNLRGPSLNVQSACSTSLAAVHLACRSLLDGECDMALAGGASIHLPQVRGDRYREEGILSPDGRCRAFDAQAQGTVGGNGAGVVLLKRLEDAVDDGDPIYACIRGSAANNDGSDKVGFTAPSIHGQSEVIAEALGVARVDAHSIDYVEAHGTATPIGDPIEVAGLSRGFGEPRPEGSCALGSVKTNLGHLDAAAGVAGLIKTALALHHGEIPPSLHFEAPNPAIDFSGGPFHVNRELTPWPRGSRPRRAGVSSFGVGGTNVHLVLEEAPARPATGAVEGPRLFTLSARTKESLDRTRQRLAEHLQEHSDLSTADVAFTLRVGRRTFDERCAVVGGNLPEIAAALAAGGKRVLRGRPLEESPKTAFLFPGQGSQRVGMGRELYGADGEFRQRLDRCCDLLREPLGIDLQTVLFPATGGEAEAARTLGRTEITQPALFAFEYALAGWWLDRGLKPAALCGHSVGEYVAACLAGIFDLEDALGLVAARAALMQSQPAGAMLAIGLSEVELEEYLDDAVSVAAVNAPNRTVVSGPSLAIDALAERLAEAGTQARRLDTSHAFHSASMEPVLAPFAEHLSKITLMPPEIPIVSNLTGDWLTDDEATDPTYWTRHLRHTVRFADGILRLADKPCHAFLEIGPGRALSAFVRSALGRSQDIRAVAGLVGGPEAADEQVQLLTACGQLWTVGVEIDLASLDGKTPGRRVALPTYAFAEERHWVAAPELTVAPTPESAAGSSATAPSPAEGATVDGELEELISLQLGVIARQLAVLEEEER